MTEQKKYPEPLEALLIILGIFAFLIVFTAVYSIISGADLEDPAALKESTRYFVLFGGAMFLIAPYIFAVKKNYDIVNVFRLKPVPAAVIGLSILIGLSAGVLTDELERLISIFFPLPDWITEMTQPLRAYDSFDWLLVITGAVLLTPLAEEFLFRGFLQISLEKKGDVTRAVLLSSLCWTLIHSNPYWAVSIFIIGIIFGFMAWRCDSILPPFSAHAANNLMAVIFLNSNTDSIKSWYLQGDHVSPLVLAVSLLILVWSIRRMSAIYQQPDF